LPHDESAGIALIYFLFVGIVAKETGSPMLALQVLVLMPIGAFLAIKIGNPKNKA
jgi:hypothetical protein